MAGVDEMFMTRSLNVKPKTTEQHVIVRSDKSVTYVTNNKILRSTLGTIEANYWQARSIAQPLCDNRAVTHATVLKQNCRYIDYSLIYMYVLYIAVLYNCSESDKQILKNIYFAYRMHIEHSLHSLPISSHYHDALLILAYGTYVWRPTANVLYCIVLYLYRSSKWPTGPKSSTANSSTEIRTSFSTYVVIISSAFKSTNGLEL